MFLIKRKTADKIIEKEADEGVVASSKEDYWWLRKFSSSFLEIFIQ